MTSDINHTIAAAIEHYEQMNLPQPAANCGRFTIERYRQFARYSPDVGTVLDVGCSSGRGGAEYAGPGHLTQHHPRPLRTRLMMHRFKNVRIRGSGRASRYVGEHFPLRGVYGSY